MRAQYIPVKPISSTSVHGGIDYVPDYLSSVYAAQLSLLPVSKQVQLEAKYVPYPELLSYDLYGDLDYWWVLCAVNGVVNPFTDMIAGMLWKVPALTDIQSMLAGSSATGGMSNIGSVVVV